MTDDIADVEILRRLVVFEAARFKKEDLDAGINELTRKGDPSRPRADDREIGLKGLVLLNIGSIDNHDHSHRRQIVGAGQGPPNIGKGGKSLQPATAHGPGADTESRL